MYNEVALTPKQKEQWDSTMSMMQWTCPGFRHLWYRLLAERNNTGKSEYVGVFTPEIPNACTDAKNIMFNPDWYFGLTLPERVYVAGHEVMHNVYGDVEFLNSCVQSGKVPMSDGTTLPFDMVTMQKAMDFRINALLTESKIGIGPKQGNFDNATTGNDALLDVYKRWYKKKKADDEAGQGDQSGNDNGQGSGNANPGGFDSVAPPGKSTGQSPQEVASQRNEQQWGVELAAARTLDEIRHQGKMPGVLKRMFQEILEPEIPWTEHIKTEFARKVGSGGKSWRKPDRRFIGHDMYLPSKSGFGAGHIVIWGDTSGSIAAPELESYLGELKGIIEEVSPKRITVLWCDSKIHHIDEVEEVSDLQTIKARGVGGGGGTSVDPVMKWMETKLDEPPEVFIGFTDGRVTFPKREPKCEVIWCSVADATYPWGDVVRIRK